MVSAKDDEVDKVVGLELGADDYVTKPYSPRELVARIRAVLRRGAGARPGAGDPRGRPGPDGRRAARRHRRRRRHRLPLKEFELLEMFLRNPGRVLTRGQLIDRVWGSDYVGDTKTLDVHVKRLRAKIEPDPATPSYLVTVRGLGYKLEPLERRWRRRAGARETGCSVGPKRPVVASSAMPTSRATAPLPLAAVAVTLLLWASAFVAIRHLGGTFSPGALSLGRLLVGSLALGVVLLSAAGRRPARRDWPRWSRSGCCGSASTTSRSTPASAGSTPAPPRC